MGYIDPDIVNQPEHFGLSTVAEIEWSDGFYQFDTTVILKNEAGEFFVAEDSGCSCPSPFESFTSLKDLGRHTKYEVAKHLKERQKEEREYRSGSELNRIDHEVVAAIAAVMEDTK